ncbi:MAG: leucyl/phenylalanyl-tRNA--protein transferase [Actinomycetota bacterium]
MSPREPRPSVWDLPDPREAEPFEDVVCVGAELDPATVLQAYRRGLFPMHLEADLLAWWSPDPRGILPLESLRVSASLRKSLRRFEITIDRDFVGVMRACAEIPREHGWITEEFIDTYCALHDLGWAHSVETWNAEGRLVGGLYGIEIGGLFAGESMFHVERDASTAALVGLVDALTTGGTRLLDVQWATEHLMSMGAIEIRRDTYLDLLESALEQLPVLSPR